MALLTSPAAIPAAKQALQERLGRWQSPDPRQFRRMQAAFDTRFENIARDMFGDDVDTVDHSGKLWALLAAVVACFLLLPTVNLMNLNVSRILERASEIGVRKSFGATGAHAGGAVPGREPGADVAGGGAGRGAGGGGDGGAVQQRAAAAGRSCS